MTTKERIEKDAVEFAEAPYYEGGGKLSVCPILYLKRGYIAGANAEAERIMKELEQRDRKMIGDAFEAGKQYGWYESEFTDESPQIPNKQHYIDSILKNNQP